MNYPVQQSAQGLASLGRGNDSMLMHVTPKEVAGLQSLAMASGGSLTINPHTGLPEAGFFDSIFDFAAPIIGGYFGMDPFLMAGIMGGKSLVTEGDPLKAAFSAFGGYSGAKLGSGFESFAKAPTIPTAELNTFENAASNIEKMDPTNLMQADKIGADKAFGIADTTPYNQLGNQGAGINLGQSPQVNQVFNQSPAGNIGYPNFSNPTIPTDVYGKAPGAPGIDLTSGATQGVQIPGATEPISPIQGFGNDVMTAAKSPVDFARHIGEGNALTGGAKIGMYAASPFMEGILQPPEYVGYEDPEKGKWTGPQGQLNLSNKYSTGLRLLPNLNQPITAKKGGIINSYAIGGPVGNPSVAGGLSDLYNRPEGQTNENISSDGYGIGRLDNLANAEAMNTAKVLGYAEGGDTHLNLTDLPSLNIKTGEQSQAGGLGGLSDLNQAIKQSFIKVNPTTGEKDYMAFYNSPVAGDSGLTVGQLFNKIPVNNVASTAGAPRPPVFGGFARGGYLDGAGDGMSDSIPATIEGKQPARLADGEFVVPADVVSHIGNGSSKAGSKRLYSMLDRVRKARTGHTKQGKQIKPEKYMPA